MHRRDVRDWGEVYRRYRTLERNWSIPGTMPLVTGRELVRLGQSDSGLDQIEEDAQTNERHQAEELLTRTQRDQG